jgi:hypothetical protein
LSFAIYANADVIKAHKAVIDDRGTAHTYGSRKSQPRCRRPSELRRRATHIQKNGTQTSKPVTAPEPRLAPLETHAVLSSSPAFEQPET